MYFFERLRFEEKYSESFEEYLDMWCTNTVKFQTLTKYKQHKIIQFSDLYYHCTFLMSLIFPRSIMIHL